MLIALATVIKQGWPMHRSATDVTVRPYFSFWNELTTHDGLIYKGQRLVVPLALRKELLQIAHGGHVGTESTLRHLREALFWTGMNREASVMVEQCEACQRHRQLEQREPLIAHDFALRPWSKVGIDLCQIDSRILLVVVDYYSNFIEIVKLNRQWAAVSWSRICSVC